MKQSTRIALLLLLGIGVLAIIFSLTGSRQWGKPLDPKIFWSARPIWYDESAQAAAHSMGRTFPPIPFHMTNFMAGFNLNGYSRKDKVPHFWDAPLDGGDVIPWHGSDLEREFWMWTLMTKLQPPERLEALQFDLAKSRHDSRKLHVDVRQTDPTLPPEAMTDDALFWACVMKERAEYAKWQTRIQEVRNQRGTVPNGFLDFFWRDVTVDRSFIVDELTSQQLQTANAWKIAYLRRLRREGVDEIYLNAYVRAWSLSPAQLD
jgi:hypothetical protein